MKTTLLVEIFLLSLVFFIEKNLFCDVYKLEKTEISGKKAKPEAMTFISRSPLDEYHSHEEFYALVKIEEEIKNDFFQIKN